MGVLLLAASQQALYGSPLRSGYAVASLFSTDHIVSNARAYPMLFLDLHGWLASVLLFAGLIAAASSRTTRAMTWSGVALAALNVVLYLPYAPFHSWPFLRFFFPATSMLFIVGPAGLAMATTEWLSGRAATLVKLLLLVALVTGTAHARDAYNLALGESYSHARVFAMGRYLKEVLPETAAVISYLHSGAVVHYTGRRTVRPDTLTGLALDQLVTTLLAHGLRPVFVLDENVEVPAFRRIFSAQTYGALEWPPRAVFESSTRILYLGPTDRQRYLDGVRWPTDVVRPAMSLSRGRR